MHKWWALSAGRLSAVREREEWQGLLRRGERMTLPAGARFVWGPFAGVIVVERGSLTLRALDVRCAPLQNLAAGDLAGTLHGSPCEMVADEPTELLTFGHSAWLDALGAQPGLTPLLLRSIVTGATTAGSEGNTA